MDNGLDTRLKAAFIRKKLLSRGYAPESASRPGTFLYILNRIPDETLIAMDREHAEETANHTALIAEYKQRQKAPKDRFKELCAAAVSR